MTNGHPRITSVQTAAVVGSYFPRQCGIATFSKDLRDAVAAEIGQRQASVVANTGRIIKSKFLRATMTGEKLVVEDLSSRHLK